MKSKLNQRRLPTLATKVLIEELPSKSTTMSVITLVDQSATFKLQLSPTTFRTTSTFPLKAATRTSKMRKSTKKKKRMMFFQLGSLSGSINSVQMVRTESDNFQGKMLSV